MLNIAMILFIAACGGCTLFNDPEKLDKIEKDVKELADDVIDDVLPGADVNGNK